MVTRSGKSLTAAASLFAGTGTLTFRSAPDYESPLDTDRDNEFDLFVVATDDGQPTASSRLSLTIRVVNIDEAGVVSLSTLRARRWVLK